MEFREIPGFPMYAISNTGIVKRVGMVFTRGRRSLPFPKVINPHHCARHQRPQQVVDIHDANDRRRTRSVSTLVALTYLGPQPSPRHVVGHKDLNRDNHDIGNLYWITRGELQATYAGSYKPRKLHPDDDYVAFRYLEVNGKRVQLSVEVGPLPRLRSRGRRLARERIVSEYRPLCEVMPGAMPEGSSAAAAGMRCAA